MTASAARYDCYVDWCEAHDLDPDDDTNLDAYDVYVALARDAAAEDRLTNEELWA